MRKVGLLESLISIAIALCLIDLGYAVYLHTRADPYAFQIAVTEQLGRYAPEWAMQSLAAGGIGASLIAMGLLAVVGFFLGGTGILIGAIAVAIYAWLTDDSKTEIRPTLGVYRVASRNIFLTLPALGSSDVPIEEQYLRLDRVAPKLRREPRTAVESLEVAVYSVLAAHREWPADPEGHHANVPLFEHSLGVADKLQGRTNDPLARVVGLAHDIGKLIAYQPNPKKLNAWIIRTHNHDQLSANLVRLLPEYARLTKDEQDTLRFVLKYYHAPHTLPAHASNRARTLIPKLRLADGLAANENQRSAQTLADVADIVGVIADTILEVLPGLNINKVRQDAHPDGFTGKAFDFVAVLEAPIRTGLSAHLKDEHIVRSLSLRIERGPRTAHPASAVIYKALEKTGLLLTTYAGYTPDNGRFAVKSGTKTFHECYLLDRSKIEKLYPEQVQHWGEKPPYKLRVLSDRSASPSADQTPSSAEPVD